MHLESQTKFGCQIVHSRSVSGQPTSNSKGYGGACLDECSGSRRELWSPKIDRHDNSRELSPWLPCRVAVNSGHPLEIILIDFLGPPGVRHAFEVKGARHAPERGVCADCKVS